MSKTGGGASRARVAVVGAGPAGLYAVRSLLGSASGVCVDVFDRLPTPYGLVRYGVAPDNQKMKSVTRVLRDSFADENEVRFLGNVSFGEDLTREDLRAHYDAVVYATGVQDERRLGIPGEDLPGSCGAREFVDWYGGHPDAAERQFALDVRHAAVVGAGNVALDVARMLVRSPAEIAATDVPDRVLETFRASTITDVHLLSRRGPVQAKFTPPELRELGELTNADVVVRPEELDLDADDKVRISANRRQRTIVDDLRAWSQRPLTGKPRRVHLRFLRHPVRILGREHVEGVVLERNELLADEQVRGTGEYETLEVGMVVRAAGYRARPLADVPFDETTSRIPHDRGRVLGEDGRPLDGEYVAGWAKRGPTGVIGTNKRDAAETVRSILTDLAARPGPERGPDQITRLLDARGVDYTDWEGWLRLDSHETQRGTEQNRPRVKVPDQPSMLDHARRSRTAPGERRAP